MHAPADVPSGAHSFERFATRLRWYGRTKPHGLHQGRVQRHVTQPSDVFRSAPDPPDVHFSEIQVLSLASALPSDFKAAI